MNSQIPLPLRDLLSEAKGCLQHHFLTGGSACIRLMVIAFAEIEDVVGSDHAERITALKDETGVLPTHFDELLRIEQSETEDIDELSYDGWTKNQLERMLELWEAIIREIYSTK